MSDITMCATALCPRAKHCKRHPDSGTIASARQSWFGPAPDINGCDRFWAVLHRQIDQPRKEGSSHGG